MGASEFIPESQSIPEPTSQPIPQPEAEPSPQQKLEKTLQDLIKRREEYIDERDEMISNRDDHQVAIESWTNQLQVLQQQSKNLFPSLKKHLGLDGAQREEIEYLKNNISTYMGFVKIGNAEIRNISSIIEELQNKIDKIKTDLGIEAQKENTTSDDTDKDENNN